MFLKNLKTNEIGQYENFQENWIEANKEEINEFLLTQAKAQKINELNEFHNSDETRELTVKSGNRQTHINMKNDRALIDEQILNMECRIKLGEANPIWVYKNQIEVPLNYKALALIKLKIAEIVDFNFNVRRNFLMKYLHRKKNQLKNVSKKLKILTLKKIIKLITFSN